MITPFKRSIQIRDGSLNDLMEETLNQVFSNEEMEAVFEIEIVKNNLLIADFFTDVDQLGLAIYHILGTIKKHAYQNGNFKLSIDFIEEYKDSLKCIRICHYASTCSKKPNDNFIGGDFDTIRKCLYNLCNWAIEGTFQSENLRRYLLYDKSIDKIL